LDFLLREYIRKTVAPPGGNPGWFPSAFRSMKELNTIFIQKIQMSVREAAEKHRKQIGMNGRTGFVDPACIDTYTFRP
jgi:hypothetical protein